MARKQIDKAYIAERILNASAQRAKALTESKADPYYLQSLRFWTGTLEYWQGMANRIECLERQLDRRGRV